MRGARLMEGPHQTPTRLTPASCPAAPQGLLQVGAQSEV